MKDLLPAGHMDLRNTIIAFRQTLQDYRLRACHFVRLQTRNVGRDGLRWYRAAIDTWMNQGMTKRGWGLMFLVAALFGVLIKSGASDRLTIGFDDFRLAPAQTLLDLKATEKRLIREGGSLSVSGDEASAPICSENQ